MPSDMFKEYKVNSKYLIYLPNIRMSALCVGLYL